MAAVSLSTTTALPIYGPYHSVSRLTVLPFQAVQAVTRSAIVSQRLESLA